MDQETKREIAEQTANVILEKVAKIIVGLLIFYVISTQWTSILFILSLPTLWLLPYIGKPNGDFTSFPILNIGMFIVLAIFVNIGVIRLIHAVFVELPKAMCRLYEWYHYKEPEREIIEKVDGGLNIDN